MNIKFIQEHHKYLDVDDEELISVSKFTERFKRKVDWDSIAKRVAEKLTKETGIKTSKQDILNKWARKRILSAEAGTLHHYIEEHQLKNNPAPVFYGQVCEKEFSTSSSEEGHKYSIPINELKNNTVYPELMIYDTDYMICGQSDKVIVVDGKINIWDFKTDAEIVFKGWSNKWKKAQTFLAPIDHLEECNGNLYSLKMSMYMYLLWKANKGKFKPGEIVIEHVHLKRDADNDNIPVIENGIPVVEGVELITIPYRKKEVMAMLKTIK